MATFSVSQSHFASALSFSHISVVLHQKRQQTVVFTVLLDSDSVSSPQSESHLGAPTVQPPLNFPQSHTVVLSGIEKLFSPVKDMLT